MPTAVAVWVVESGSMRFAVVSVPDSVELATVTDDMTSPGGNDLDRSKENGPHLSDPELIRISLTGKSR